MTLHPQALKLRAKRRELRLAVEDYRLVRDDPNAEVNEAAQRVADICVELADLKAEK